MEYKHLPENPDGFSIRRDSYCQAYCNRILTLLEANRPISKTPVPGDPDVRSWIWNAQILFACGEADSANEILRRAELHPCEFSPMLLTQILVKESGQVQSENQEKIRSYLRDMLPRAASERIHPAMYNDNFSNMATYVLLVAGTLLQLPEYVSLGKTRLEALCDQLRRCGTVMEYGSPTYSPINVLILAETANHAPDEKIRRTALRCEERLWVEMATHYHAETARLAGPYSRAYYVDTVGHTHLASMLFWAVFGDVAFVNPIHDLMPPRENQVIHYDLDTLMLPNCGWLLLTEYHLPDHLRELALHKVYPFEVNYMTECIPSDGLAYLEQDLPFCQYGGHRSPVHTYMTEEYAMGTAQQQYHEGAISDTFHITCRNRDKAESLPDTNVIYSRFLFNEKQPGKRNHYAYYGLQDPSSWRDEGRKLGIQHRNTALILYKPKYLEQMHVASMKMSILIPTHFRCEMDLWLGDQPVSDFSATSAVPVPIFLRIHNAWFAFLPLELTDFGRRDAVRIEKIDHHVHISFSHYEGPDRSFKVEELANMQSGFVCIAGTAQEFGTMEAFMAHARDTVITDRMECSAKMWTRRVQVRTPDTALYFVYNPLLESVITATANKRPVGMNVFASDMLSEAQIPFLQD